MWGEEVKEANYYIELNPTVSHPWPRWPLLLVAWWLHSSTALQIITIIMYQLSSTQLGKVQEKRRRKPKTKRQWNWWQCGVEEVGAAVSERLHKLMGGAGAVHGGGAGAVHGTDEWLLSLQMQLSDIWKERPALGSQNTLSWVLSYQKNQSCTSLFHS